MKTISSITVLGFVALVSIAAMAALGGLKSIEAHPAAATRHVLSVPQNSNPSGPPAPGPCDPTTTDDNQNANCEFMLLTHADQTWTEANGAKRPVWTKWQDKCDLCLDDCSQGSTCKAKAHTARKSDLLATKKASQLLQNARLQAAPSPSEGQPAARNNQLASVLFSPEIRQVISKLNNKPALEAALEAVKGKSGTDRQIDTVEIPDKLTIVKLIWEVAVPGKTGSPVYVYQGDPTKPGFTAPLEGSRLPNPTNWPAQYIVDGTKGASCQEPVKLASNPLPTISANCFYHYTVDAASGNVQQQLSRDANEVITGQPEYTHRAIVLLVGFHVMTFNQNHKLWQWMTFYWTKDAANTPGLQNPWLHYQMMTTSASGELDTGIAQPVANPYLEGHLDRQGTATNCVSCHSLAAYSSLGAKSDQASNLINGTSSNDSGEPRFPASQKAAVNHCYFDGSVRTHFIWSVANNPLLKQSQLPFPVACSTRAALNHPH